MELFGDSDWNYWSLNLHPYFRIENLLSYSSLAFEINLVVVVHSVLSEIWLSRKPCCCKEAGLCKLDLDFRKFERTIFCHQAEDPVSACGLATAVLWSMVLAMLPSGQVRNEPPDWVFRKTQGWLQWQSCLKIPVPNILPPLLVPTLQGHCL